MDIFVLPSLAEGISRALMESMAMGIPSVCSAIDGNLEAVVDGETGYTFLVNNHKSLAEKLFILINDEAKRKYMGEKARNKVKKEFDMKTLSDKYENLYLKILNPDKKE
jgi:glycosyltransferase involved in cell wall biosynthesis